VRASKLIVIGGDVVKILTFLKGDTMKFQFNPAQLSRPQQNALMDVLGVIQSENQNEIEITPVEFPLKLKVKLDDDVEMLLGWNPESDSYSGISMPKDWEPESPNKPKAGAIKSFELPESQKDTVDLPKTEPKTEPELDLSPVLERVQALARAFINLAEPFDSNVRTELWSEFCKVLFKEFLK